VAEALASILVSLDRIAGRDRRHQAALAAAVAAGELHPLQAWPEYFSVSLDDDEAAVPGLGADMSAFEWENATQESAERDLEAVMAMNQVVSVGDQAAPPARPPLTDDLEWT